MTDRSSRTDANKLADLLSELARSSAVIERDVEWIKKDQAEFKKVVDQVQAVLNTSRELEIEIRELKKDYDILLKKVNSTDDIVASLKEDMAADTAKIQARIDRHSEKIKALEGMTTEKIRKLEKKDAEKELEDREELREYRKMTNKERMQVGGASAGVGAGLGALFSNLPDIIKWIGSMFSN